MPTARPELLGTNGMVASTHWLATAAGAAMFEAGGNAFDAAVAAGFTLQVVEPHMNGLGGEAPAIFYSAADDAVRVVNAQGVAPAAATIARFRDWGLDLVPGTGLLAACVPAAFDGWMLLARHGRLSLRQLMTHAISHAERGYPVIAELSETIAEVEELLARRWTDSAATYMPAGRVPRAGDLLRNPVLAATLRRLVAEAERSSADRDDQLEAARNAFYRGFVAEWVAAFIEQAEPVDAAGLVHRGLLSADDFWRYRATLEDAVSLSHGRYRVHKPGPWSQGPVFLQQLSLLQGFDLDPREPLAAEFIHIVIECAKLAFADREAWYGDPSFVEVPISNLLEPTYASDRRALVDEHSSSELRPGPVNGRLPRLPALIDRSRSPREGSAEPVWGRYRTAPKHGDTCHVDAVDRDGNLVSVTPSGGWLQGSPLIPALGFSLGTRAQMFWLEEGLPNSLAPGKRPRTTLSPALASRDGEPYLAFGTPGGDGQDQWPLLFFLNHVHFGMGLQESIEAAVFHSTHFPSSFYPRDRHPREVVMEASVPRDVRADLERRGHRINLVPEWSQGRTTAVARDGRILRAVANPRGMQAYAGGR